MIHIYCGDGKGKTTAAVGLAVRAAGRGKKILIVRFLKNEDSGEVDILRNISGIEVVPCEKTFGFFRSMSEETKKQAALYFSKRFRDAVKRIETEKWDMLILDEIMAACQYAMVPEDEVLEFLKQCSDKRSGDLEVILTGRNPSERILSYADYVTEMVKRKHPYDKGITARRGIEW
ncbi:MAG: cob(I)yrinic acid a,c-diamide adenosyltransferase [bacterium]|nr:cob(I)yrinic acid a,c-diamide adenosyltransferase [bacterium]